MARLSQSFPSQVMKRHIERSHRVNYRAAPAVHRRPHVELFPQRLWIHGVLANQHFGETESHGMRTRRIDAGTGNPGIDVGFADTSHTFVGVANFDHDVIFGRELVAPTS